MSRDFRNLTVDNKLTTHALNANEVKMAYDRTDNISSNYSEITNLLTENAQFVNFTADNASITNLDVVNLTVTNLTITNLTITGTTSANTISSTNLTYTNGVINNALYLPNVNNSVDLSFENSVGTGIYKVSANDIFLGSNGTSNGNFGIANSLVSMNKQLFNVDGTEQLPSYSFENKTDTGFFRPGDNQLGFTINGDEKVRITTDALIMDNVNSNTRINAVNGTNQSSSFSFNNSQSVGIFRGTNINEIGFTTSNTQTNMYFNNLSTTVYDPIMQELDTINISSTLNGGYALAKDVKPIISPYLASNTISNWNYADYLENTNASLTCIAFSGSLNRFVNLGNNGLGAYSDDGGINFKNCTMNGQTINMKFSSIVWASVPQDEFVAVSTGNDNSANDNLAYSANGITWTASTSINFRGNRVIYSKELNIFVAVGTDQSTVNKAAWSSDGQSWNAGTGISVTGSLSSTNFRALAYAPELQRFVTISRNAVDNATYIYYSTDGKAWSNTGVTTDASIIGADFSSVAWSSQLGLFVAIASSTGTGSSRIMYSYDGIIWNNTGITGYNSSLVGNRILWVDDLGHFVAIYENTNTGIGYSQNGFNWSYTGTSGGFPNGTARDIVYSRELGEFVAVFNDPPAAAPLTKNRIVHTEYKFMQPTSKNVFNNALVRVEDNGQYNYKYGIDTSNVGNILDFYNPYGTGQNLFPKYNFDTTTLSGLPSTPGKYWGACLARNCKIYAIGVDVASILVIDPFKNTYKTIPYTPGSSAGSSNSYYLGLVQAPNGLLYAIPSNANNVLTLDPITEIVNPTAMSTGSTLQFKYRGGVLAPNGNIYCFPNTGNVGVINTSANTFSTFGTGLGNYNGGVLGTNGNIYCVPAQTNITSVLVINTINNTTFTITIPSQVNNSHSGGAIAPNGNIYFAPRASDSILKIAPPYGAANVSFIPTSESTSSNYIGAVCGLDGNIYFSPNNSTNVLILNPNNDNFDKTSISGLPVSTDKYRSIISSTDGRLFCIPFNDTNIGILKIGPPTQVNPWMLGPSFNKY